MKCTPYVNTLFIPKRSTTKPSIKIYHLLWYIVKVVRHQGMRVEQGQKGARTTGRHQRWK